MSAEIKAEITAEITSEIEIWSAESARLATWQIRYGGGRPGSGGRRAVVPETTQPECDAL